MFFIVFSYMGAKACLKNTSSGVFLAVYASLDKMHPFTLSTFGTFEMHSRAQTSQLSMTESSWEEEVSETVKALFSLASNALAVDYHLLPLPSSNLFENRARWLKSSPNAKPSTEQALDWDVLFGFLGLSQAAQAAQLCLECSGFALDFFLTKL